MAVGWRPPFLIAGPSTGLLMVRPVKREGTQRQRQYHPASCHLASDSCYVSSAGFQSLDFRNKSLSIPGAIPLP